MIDDDLKEHIQAALNRAYFFLKFRPRSEKEVKDYLVKKAKGSFWSTDVIPAAVESLKENNFINDANFIIWFVEQRNVAKPKSRFALTAELQKFGISKDLIQEYFEQTPLEEDNLAYEALRRRWSRYQYLDKQERFKKAAAFLGRRGFSFDIIKKTITKLENS